MSERSPPALTGLARHRRSSAAASSAWPSPGGRPQPGSDGSRSTTPSWRRPAPAQSSWAAAGMLAPVTEVHYGEEALLTLDARRPRPLGRLRRGGRAGQRHRPGLPHRGHDRGRPRRRRPGRASKSSPSFRPSSAWRSPGCGPARRAALEPALSPRVRGGLHRRRRLTASTTARWCWPCARPACGPGSSCVAEAGRRPRRARRRHGDRRRGGGQRAGCSPSSRCGRSRASCCTCAASRC